MTETRHILAVYDPDWIVRFVTDQSIDFETAKELLGWKGPTDQFGYGPTLAVDEFFAYIYENGDRFPMADEYAEWTLDRWAVSTSRHPRGFPPDGDKPCPGAWGWTRRGLWKRRLIVSFYRSLVDNFHVFGLVYRSGWYDRAMMDTARDGHGKKDLTLYRDGREVAVNLKGRAGTLESRRSEEAKVGRPSNEPHAHLVINLSLPRNRPMGLGGKRWFDLSDLNRIDPLTLF